MKIDYEINYLRDSSPVGSPFSCNISDVGRVIPPTEDKISVGKVATFKVDCGNLGPPQVQVIKMFILHWTNFI